MALCYIDARLVCDRLDDVLGVAGWEDTYQLLPDGSVQCRLSLRLDGRVVTREDVGSPSEQPDAGDRLKAAFSDALKRAAVKFGVGRYLYRLPSQWVDYDPVKKQLVQIPSLPAFAMPGASQARGKAFHQPDRLTHEKPKQADPAPPRQAAPPSQSKSLPNLPASGEELARRVRDYDAKLAEAGVITAGALIAGVSVDGVRAGFPADIAMWEGKTAMLFGVTAVVEFEKQARVKSRVA